MRNLGDVIITLKTKFTLDMILAAVKTTPTSTQDVYKAVGCSRQTARNKLGELADKGVIDAYEVGHGGNSGKLFIWMKKEVE